MKVAESLESVIKLLGCDSSFLQKGVKELCNLVSSGSADECLSTFMNKCTSFEEAIHMGDFSGETVCNALSIC